MGSSRRISAVDRNGKTYTSNEMREIFGLLYHKSPKAISVMFPSITRSLATKRAIYYGIGSYKKYAWWSKEHVAIFNRLWPDRTAIAKETGRSSKDVRTRAECLGLSGAPSARFTDEEYALIRRGLTPPGRTDVAAYKARCRLGISLKNIRSVQAITPEELTRRIGDCISRGYPDFRRSDMIQVVIEECLAGRCSAEPADIAKAAKKASTAVYKLHPDRGAPVSMDACLFDDGTATVGDRIASDAFHF